MEEEVSMHYIRIVLLILYWTNLTMKLRGQDSMTIRTGFGQQDIKDWLVEKKIMEPRPEKEGFLLLVPIIASNPTAGVLFGMGLTYTFKNKPSDSHVSTVTGTASYSTKGLLNLNLKSNAFVLHERLVLNGDWRFLYNLEITHGLGSAGPNGGAFDLNGYEVSPDTMGQDLKYYQVRLHETGSWKVAGNFYAGIGLHYDYYYKITDAAIEAGDTSRSFHYQYSIRHGFDPQHYTAMGVSLNLLYDSRDNQINAYKGTYANINYRINPEGLGSSKNSTLLLTEYRGYFSLDGARRRNILGVWLYGNFLTSGNAPYLLLPAIGYDQRQRTGRGYTFGRFRGEELAYGEGEYRFPISAHTGILGGVVFLNYTTTSDREHNIGLFNYLRGAYGGGLRVMVDKKTRTRIEVDAGVADRSAAFYFGAQETF